MKIIVTGDTEFSNYILLEKWLDKITRKITDITIMVGCREGAEKLAEKWVWENRKRRVALMRFHKEVKYKDNASMKRDEEMVAEADGAVIFLKKRRSLHSERIAILMKKKRVKIIGGPK